MGNTQPLARTQQITHLWTLAQPVVSAFVVSSVANIDDAEDIVGQVAETIVNKFDDYDSKRPFLPWAMRIAQNRVLQYLDRRKNDRNRFFDEKTLQLLANTHQELSDEISPRLSALNACLEKVTGKARKTLELFYVENLPADEIGERISMSSNAVWVMLHRSREILAGCIERKLSGSGGGI